MVLYRIVAYHFLPALRTNDNTCRQAEEQKMYFCLHDPALSPFITYHLILSKSNTMGVTSGAGTALPSGSPEFNFVICELRVVKSLVFCVTFVATIYFLFALSFELRLLIKVWYLELFFRCTQSHTENGNIHVPRICL